MKTTCPQCQNSAKITEEHLGKQVRCKKCGGTFRASCDPLDELDAVEPSPPASAALATSASQLQEKRYYARENGGPPFHGPLTLTEIRRETELGRLPQSCEILEESMGQKVRTLKEATGWQPLSGAIPAPSTNATPTGDGLPKKYYARKEYGSTLFGPYTKAEIDKFVEQGKLPKDGETIEATVESLLIRMIYIQEKQLHWLRAISIIVTVAFALVFIFGMTLKVK